MQTVADACEFTLQPDGLIMNIFLFLPERFFAFFARQIAVRLEVHLFVFAL